MAPSVSSRFSFMTHARIVFIRMYHFHPSKCDYKLSFYIYFTCTSVYP